MLRGEREREREREVKTEQRTNRTKTVGRVSEQLVYKRYWNILRIGRTMRCNRSSVASKRRKPSRDERCERKIRGQTQNSEKNESGRIMRRPRLPSQHRLW